MSFEMLHCWSWCVASHSFEMWFYTYVVLYKSWITSLCFCLLFSHAHELYTVHQDLPPSMISAFSPPLQ